MVMNRYIVGILACPATSEEHIEKLESHETDLVEVDLLQIKQDVHKGEPFSGEAPDHVKATGGAHRFLLVRPCQRFAGDGMSGLPRHRVTGECCGDGVCSSARWESSETCPGDCPEVAATADSVEDVGKLLPPTESTLFGKLEGMEHDEYHCEDMYEEKKDNEDGFNSCSYERTESLWLDSLLERAAAGTLPFDMPPPGSVAVEVGCGLGQDSRNIASKAGYSLTSVDVSPSAIEKAKEMTLSERLGVGPGKIEFLAYDAMALPEPKQRVDFYFDATVYCGLRFKYLARDYEAWSRLLTPGHTLVHLQCWNWEQGGWPVPNTRKDMEADFEPLFDILHSEACEKNQGGPGWCFYMKLKTPETRQQIFEDRLRLQQVVRDGDTEYLRQNFHERLVAASKAEVRTLHHIAQANQHVSSMRYLESVSSKEDDPFFSTIYGAGADISATEDEDQVDGNGSIIEATEIAYIKANWERSEAELIYQAKVDELRSEIRELRASLHQSGHSNPGA